MTQSETNMPLGRRRILVLTGTALVTALLVVFGGILPAEYNLDPTGLGRMTGTAKLWAPEEKVVGTSASDNAGASAKEVSLRTSATPYRSDEVEITLQAGGDPSRNDELEYKVRMKQGASFIYSWEAPGAADTKDIYVEAHGHTLTDPAAMTVAYYKKHFGTRDNGLIIAPFDGVHGWFFQNQSPKPLKIKLRFAGFYELVPPGEPGNEGELQAKRLQ
jgi:hypothetical protein